MCCIGRLSNDLKKMKQQLDILLVEDELDLGNVFSRFLQYKGFTVHWASTAQDASDAFRMKAFRLLLIDVQLPDGDGFSLAENIMQTNPYQPIFFLTAKQERVSRMKGLSLGAIDYITKPFEMDEVLLKIKNLLAIPLQSIAQPKTENEFYIGQLTLNTKQYMLTDNKGNTQKLTVREMEILRHLILNKNLLVPKKDLLLQFWGDTDYFNGKSLEVFISRIRKLLQSDADLRIESVYGAGYILHQR